MKIVAREGSGISILASALITGAAIGGAGALWSRHGVEIFMIYATGLGMICM